MLMNNKKLIFSFFLLLTVAVRAQDSIPAPTSYTVNKVTFKMVRVEKGGFWMGAQHADTLEFNYDRQSQIDEVPVHHVNIHEDFYIGQTEVSQKLWKAVMGYNPSKKKCCKKPVTNVSYLEVQEFIRLLDSLTGMHFRLPTEEEWEFAARGGNMSKGYVYSGGNETKKSLGTTATRADCANAAKNDPTNWAFMICRETYGNGVQRLIVSMTKNATPASAKTAKCKSFAAAHGNCPKPPAVWLGAANACPICKIPSADSASA